MSIVIGSNWAANPTSAASQTAAQRPARPAASELEAPQQEPGPSQVQRAVETIEQLIKIKAPNSLSFSIDDSTGRSIVRIVDQSTGEIVRQIPPEEMLDIARSISRVQGMLIKQQA